MRQRTSERLEAMRRPTPPGREIHHGYDVRRLSAEAPLSVAFATADAARATAFAAARGLLDAPFVTLHVRDGGSKREATTGGFARDVVRDANINYEASAESRELQDAGARVAHMDQLGIDIQVIYPTVFLRPALRTREAEYALVHSYNRWLGEISGHAPDRLRWVVMPPLLSPDKIRDEVLWGRDHGACGIFMRGLEWDRTAGDEFFYPLYEQIGRAHV